MKHIGLNSLKTELWKATHNSYFLISLAIGLFLVLCNVTKTFSYVQGITEQSLRGQQFGAPIYNFSGCSLFIWWIAQNGMTWGSITFFQIWPILAAMPFAWSYAQEARSGCVVFYISRMGRKNYLFAKFLAVFISGGLLIFIPVLTDLLLCALICPAEKMQFMEILTMITERSFLGSLFFAHPWIHALIWCGMEFVIGGSTAVLSFLAGGKARFPSVLILVPFAISYILAVAGMVGKEILNTNFLFNPISMATLANYSIIPGWLIAATVGLFIIVSFLAARYWMVKRDVL